MIDMVMSLIAFVIAVCVICIELVVRFAIVFAVFIIGFALLKIGGVI
jgi:hypothetical protein